MYNVFGTLSCPYSTKAQQALTACGLPFTFYDLAVQENNAKYLKTYEPYVLPAHKTIPIVFLYHVFIGGYQDLLRHLER